MHLSGLHPAAPWWESSRKWETLPGHPLRPGGAGRKGLLRAAFSLLPLRQDRPAKALALRWGPETSVPQVSPKRPEESQSVCATWDSDLDGGWWKGAFLGGLGEAFQTDASRPQRKGLSFYSRG